MLIGVVVVLGSGARATTSEQCGDADLSGTRTVTDGVRVLQTAAELSGGCSVASRCDIDGNGTISVTDGVAALRIAAGLETELACRNVVVDFSDYAFFAFNRRSAFGFCPPLDSVSQVTLSVGAEGVTRHALEIVEGTPGDPDCITDVETIPEDVCFREVMLPDRLLTPDEVARVDAAFSAITREQQRNPDCARITFDPCLINEFAWDTRIVTDFACGEPRLLEDQAAALIAVLDSLR
jgi:hypothetical protein